MGQMTALIVATSQRGLGFAAKAASDIPAETFASRPRLASGAAVDCNHPAFVFGHLSLYPARVAMLCGLDPAPYATPASYEGLFKAGVECRDDAARTIYPAKDELVSHFTKNYEGLLAALPSIDDAVLFRDTPDERYRQFFPHVGMAANFMLTSHVMMHMGQISTWRRCFGLKSVM